MTDYLQALFTCLGLARRRQQVESRRESIIARLDGVTPPDEGSPAPMLEAHQDAVPTDGTKMMPFAAGSLHRVFRQNLRNIPQLAKHDGARGP